MEGVKHFIECHCTLPQYRKKDKKVYHKFPVFSIISDSDVVLEKNAQCNNCGIVHRVFDICKSEILIGKEDSKATILGIEDIKLMLPSVVSNVLENYSCDLPTWEQALFFVENKIYDQCINLSKDEDKESGMISGKLMYLTERATVKIETFSEQVFI